MQCYYLFIYSVWDICIWNYINTINDGIKRKKMQEYLIQMWTIIKETYRRKNGYRSRKTNTIQFDNSPGHVRHPSLKRHARQCENLAPRSPLSACSCPHRSHDQLTSTPAGSKPICNRLAFPSTTTEPLQPQIVPSLPLELRDCLSTRLDPTSLYIKIYATRFFLLPTVAPARPR